jgi:hypothetical protein
MDDSPDAHDEQIVRSSNDTVGPWTKSIARAASLIGRVRRMRRTGILWRFAFIGAYLGLSGCVLGYGPCLFQQPVKNTLTGHVRFRDYPAADGVDHVPVLSLDRTAYIYAPAESHHCLSANDVQLVGIAEFPRNVIENSHVSVDGVLFQAGSGRQHTPFLMDVTTILPIPAAH